MNAASPAPDKLAILGIQLTGCRDFLDQAIRTFGEDSPYTKKSYSFVRSKFAAALAALKPLAPIAPLDGVPALKSITNLRELDGYVKFAMTEVAQRINKAGDSALPDGVPGTAEYEVERAKRNAVTTGLKTLHQALADVRAALASPLHRLDLPEQERRTAVLEAKARWLEKEISKVAQTIKETEAFLADCRKTEGELRANLETTRGEKVIT